MDFRKSLPLLLCLLLLPVMPPVAEEKKLTTCSCMCHGVRIGATDVDLRACMDVCGRYCGGFTDRHANCDESCEDYCKDIHPWSNDGCEDSCKSSCSFDENIYAIVDIFYIIAGVIAALMIAVNAFRFLTSEDPLARRSAKQGIAYVIIALILVGIAGQLVALLLRGSISGVGMTDMDAIMEIGDAIKKCHEEWLHTDEYICGKIDVSKWSAGIHVKKEDVNDYLTLFWGSWSHHWIGNNDIFSNGNCIRWTMSNIPEDMHGEDKLCLKADLGATDCIAAIKQGDDALCADFSEDVKTFGNKIKACWDASPREVVKVFCEMIDVGSFTADVSRSELENYINSIQPDPSVGRTRFQWDVPDPVTSGVEEICIFFDTFMGDEVVIRPKDDAVCTGLIFSEDVKTFGNKIKACWDASPRDVEKTFCEMIDVSSFTDDVSGSELENYINSIPPDPDLGRARPAWDVPDPVISSMDQICIFFETIGWDEVRIKPKDDAECTGLM